MEHTLRSKSLYKIFLSLIKYTPVCIAIIQIICLILMYLNITPFLFTCIGGTSILFLVILWLISFIFRFCNLYRIPLTYVSLVNGILMYDNFIGIDISIIFLYRGLAILTGIAIIAYIWYAYKNRNNPNNKIDYIKNLCERYGCSCSI